jgi:hypothetical protein
VDPDTARQIVTTATIIGAALGAIAGVVGAVLGAIINQRGAAKTAERTLAGQRVLARDAALREWRAGMVRPLLDYQRGRVHEFGTLWSAIGLGDAASIRAASDRVGPHSRAFADAAWAAVPEPKFQKAAKQWLDADLAAHKFFSGLAAGPAVPRGSAGHAVNQVLDELSAAMNATYEAAESYVHGL